MIKTKLTQLFQEFCECERISGIILIVCTILSIGIANSAIGNGYTDFWHIKLGIDTGGIALKYSLEHWINDGLMAVFFLMIGLEIERELYIGELSRIKNATLPIFAALGGMALSAGLHLAFNRGTDTQAGFGIPMATDIAFALGVLALLGNRVPPALKVFLAALAIIDDLGAILVIAIFYVNDFQLVYLLSALGIFALLILLNRLGVQRLVFYILPGILMWYLMLQSGVHATVAGVLLAFTIPFKGGSSSSPSYKLQHFLHKPIAFVVLPIFALANTGISLAGDWSTSLVSPNSLGISLGLVVGKPLGILLFSLLAVKTGLSQLPDNVNWKHILGAGFLGGIGFTMSIFITLLAFADSGLVLSSKISIFLASLLAGLIGFLILRGKQAKPVTANA